MVLPAPGPDLQRKPVPERLHRHLRSKPIGLEIAKIAAVMRAHEPLRFGRMYFRQISADAQHFGLPFGTDYAVAFSRLLYGQEILVAYDVSANERNDCVVVDALLHTGGDTLSYLYGGSGTLAVQVVADGTHFVRLQLPSNRLVILA